MTKRGWSIAKMVIIGLAAVDMLVRFWLRHVFTVARPRQAEGIFVRPFPIDDGSTFISMFDYTLLTALEITGFVLVIIFLSIVGVSRRRPREART